MSPLRRASCIDSPYGLLGPKQQPIDICHHEWFREAGPCERLGAEPGSLLQALLAEIQGSSRVLHAARVAPTSFRNSVDDGLRFTHRSDAKAEIQQKGCELQGAHLVSVRQGERFAVTSRPGESASKVLASIRAWRASACTATPSAISVASPCSMRLCISEEPHHPPKPAKKSACA